MTGCKETNKNFTSRVQKPQIVLFYPKSRYTLLMQTYPQMHVPLEQLSTLHTFHYAVQLAVITT